MNEKTPFEKGFIAILMLLAVGVLCWLFSDFLAALFFSVLICAATFSYYQWFTKRLSAISASLVMTFLMSVVFILPLTYIILMVGLEASKLIQQLHFDQKTLFFLMQKISHSLPFFDLFEEQIISHLKDNLATIINSLKDISIKSIQSIFNFASNFTSFLLISIFALFYFYQDGTVLLQRIKILIPLSDELSDVIIKQFLGLSIILVSNVFLVALLQGVAFSLAMSFVGLPWLFLGLLVAFASFVPVVGAALIWLPISVYLYINGEPYHALFVVCWGMVIIGGVIDNIVRPILLKKMAQRIGEQKSILEHTLITVLSTFAGIIKFGVLGLFLGPIIAAMAITVFDIYVLKYKKQTLS